MNKFKYSVAYKCDNEERQELIDILHKLGYNSYVYCNNLTSTYLCTNYAGTSSDIGFDFKHQRDYQETLCDSKELFLALASIRNSDEFFEGEYVMCIKGHYSQYTKDKIYILKDSTTTVSDDLGSTTNGFNSEGMKNRFRKATKEEIINHFNSQKKEVKESLVGIKFINPDKPNSIYTITEQTDKDITFIWFENGKTTRPISQYNEHITKGIWKVLEEVKEEKQMDKKIIGYKLVKPEYEQAASNIAQYSKYQGQSFKEYIEKTSYKNGTLDIFERKLKEAGVLDLWFEPVYEEKLVVGKWYVISKDSDYANHVDALVNFQGIKKDAFGFNHEGQWCNWFGNPDLWNLEGSYYSKTIIKLATESEVKDALIKEATKRGFKEGVKFGKLAGIDSDVGTILRSYDLNDRGLYSENNYIFFDGKWAEILSSTPDITINNYQAKFLEDTVEFGCAKFHKNLFLELVKINESIEVRGATTNRVINKITLGSGEFTYSQIKEIADYFKNN